MVGGKTRNLLDHPDEKFTVGKTLSDRRNLREQSPDFLIDAGDGGSGDEIDTKPVRANPVEGYPGINQTGIWNSRSPIAQSNSGVPVAGCLSGQGGISTGHLEGTKNKIKTWQKQTYGFRDMEFFKLKIYAPHKLNTLTLDEAPKISKYGSKRKFRAISRKSEGQVAE